MDGPAARQRFAEVIRRDDAAIDLAEAALLIAAEEYPGLQPAPYLRYLDDLAARVSAVAGDSADPRERVAGLNAEIFEREGYRGNADEYYDPRNSFLNEVIDRRLGIPITLSIVYLEVGWRNGWPVAGVGMPGHFLVKYDTGAEPLLVDPFSHGRLLTPAECQQRLNQLYGGAIRLQPDYLAAVSKRQILARMLTNLKGIYFQSDDHERALAAVDRVLLVNPSDAIQYRDRGIIYSRQGQFSAAASDFQTYLQSRPEPADAPSVRRALEEVWRHQARLN